MRFLSMPTAAPPPAPAPERKAVNLVAPSQQGRPYRDSWNVDRTIRDGMQRVTWVFRCVHVRASKSAGLPIVVRRGHPDSGELVEGHELLPLLNAYANPDEAAYVFRYRLSAVLDLNRLGAFIEIDRSRTGGVIALRLLPPGATAPVPGKGGQFLDHYRVKIQGLEEQRLAPDKVVWVRNPHPTDPYGGMTPMEAAGIAVDSEWLAKLYQRNFLQNDGRMGMLVAIKGDIDQEDLDEMRAQVNANAGPGGAGRTSVIGAGEDGDGHIGGIDVHDMSTTPREAAYIDMRKITKEEILAAFGMPESVGTGNASQRTFENADAEYLTFWRDTMIDHCRMLDRPFDRVDNDASTFVGHDFTSVAVLQRDLREQQKHDLEEVRLGTLTPNEYRVRWNRDAYAEGGDDVLSPLNLVPTASTQRGNLDEPAPAGEPTKTLERKDLVAWGGFTVDAKRLASRRRERLRKISSWEKQTARIVKAFFGRQERAVLAKLNSTKTRRGTRHWRFDDDTAAATKAIGAGDVFDPADWDKGLEEDLLGVLQACAEDFGQDAYDTIAGAAKAGATDLETKADDGYDPEAGSIPAYLKLRAKSVSDINRTTADELELELDAGEEAGESIEALAARVSSVFERARTTRTATIAQTETVAASNLGSLDGAKQTGAVETKAWLATTDDRTRESHADADGQEVGLDDDFEVGEATLAYPGDPGGPPEEIIFCRCTVVYASGGDPLL